MNNKGITIISLIVTIVLMLILATVVVNVAIDDALFSSARKVNLETEIVDLQKQLMKKQFLNENVILEGKINDVLNIDSNYNDKLVIENGELAYYKDKWSDSQIEILIELGLKTSIFDQYKENAETIYYIAMEETVEKYEGLTNVGTLEEFRDLVNAGNFSWETALLIENIELNKGEYTITTDGIEFTDDAVQWTPIGTFTNSFAKIFDGQGYTISGIYINNTNNEQALFYANNGTIKNVRIKQGYIKANEYVSAIVAKNIGTIENCYSNVKMEGVKHVSGIASYNRLGTVKNSWNQGIIIGNECVGGIVGSVNSGTVEACLNEGDVTGSGVFTGGIVGYLSEEIKNCYNLGVITSEKAHTGGIVGIISNKDAIVYNCYNLGNIDGIGSSGAIAGRNDGTVKNCYYLETSSDCLVGIAYTGILNDGSSKTATEMKTSDFLTLLNTIITTTTTTDPETEEEVTTTTTTTQSAWVADTIGINEGFPILSWQAEEND